MKLGHVTDWFRNGLGIAAGFGVVVGFLIGLLIFGKPWHLPPDWGDIPTWLTAVFAAVAGVVALRQLSLLRQQIEDESKRNARRDEAFEAELGLNARRDELIGRQLAEADRRADTDLRRQAEDVELKWVQRTQEATGTVTIGVVMNKSRRPISHITCKVMSKADGKLLRMPDTSAVMPLAQKDDFGGPAVGTKPLLEFPLLGRNENCGFMFNGLLTEPDQILVAWFTDDAGNRWQLDETLHLVKATAGDETVYKP